MCHKQVSQAPVFDHTYIIIVVVCQKMKDEKCNLGPRFSTRNETLGQLCFWRAPAELETSSFEGTRNLGTRGQRVQIVRRQNFKSDQSHV